MLILSFKAAFYKYLKHLAFIYNYEIFNQLSYKLSSPFLFIDLHDIWELIKFPEMSS